MATLRLLWTSFRSKLANRIPQQDLQMLGIHFATPGLSIEPLQSFMTEISGAGGIPDPFTDWQEKLGTATAIIASRPNRATQAAECRVKILDTLEKIRLWKYILSIEDKTLRDTVLRHMFLEKSLSEGQRAWLMIREYAYSLLSDLALTGIYENQFSKELSLDAFTKPYEAMVDFSAKVLVKRIIADETVRNDQITDLDVADKVLVAIRCRDVFSDGLISGLSEIRENFRNAIAEGFVDNLYVFQKRFAEEMIEIESVWSAEVNHLRE